MTQHMVANRPASQDRYRWLQWFAAADPGDTLLLNATRATLAVVASVLAVVALTHLFAGGQQLTTASTVVLALVGSMLCTVLVSDATIRDQKITVLLLFLRHGLLGRGRHARIPGPLAGRHPAARLHLPGLLRAPFRAEVRRAGNGGSSEFSHSAQHPSESCSDAVVGDHGRSGGGLRLPVPFRDPPAPSGARPESKYRGISHPCSDGPGSAGRIVSGAWAQPRRNGFPEASSSCISVRG